MLTAFGVSIAFLICYIVYHAQVGSVPITKTGFLRMVYFSILITHTTLAATVPVLAIIHTTKSAARRFERSPQNRAVGSTPALIAGRLQSYSLRLAFVGIAFGGLLSFWLRRAIETYLFRTDAGGWIVWLSVCSLILLCAVGASAIPARRAARLDPMEVLRLD